MISSVVKTIYQQIMAGGQIKVMSWGAHNWIAVDDYTLRFTVNGHHHKGYVKVRLTAMDDYTVTLIDKKGNIVKAIEMVYCDNITEIIDNAVERIAAYGK